MPLPSDLTPPLYNAASFIEQQFPVAKVSMESYKERKSVFTQTLTGLGKWWGRKPLILVRAALLGLLMPASDKPEKDREIFLKLLTMDKDGLIKRKSKSISQARLVEEVQGLTANQKKRYLDRNDLNKLKRLTKEEKVELQHLVYERMNYAEKLEYANRPEQMEGPSLEAWTDINAHLGTDATSLPELVHELGEKRFGHTPRVGDAFCGGGSIPFEASRLGYDSYGSDLNPVAALLTWASINLIGGGKEISDQVKQAQEKIYTAVDWQVTEWGIEHNSLGWRADAYLYCVEVTDPESGWKIPLIPSLAIAPKPRVIARLVPDKKNKCYDIEILENVSQEEYDLAVVSGTVKESRLVPPEGNISTPIDVIRQGLRMWENNDVYHSVNDVFQERLYCVRWVETTIEDEKLQITRHFCATAPDDLQREKRVLELLNERFSDWQIKGFIPSRRIEPGAETTRLQRERGWTYWHHLFTPRQLLTNGLFSEQVLQSPQSLSAILLLGRVINNNSRLSRWKPNQSDGIGGVVDVFSNQALNTFYNFGCRPILTHHSLLLKINSLPKFDTKFNVLVHDCRTISETRDIWITDPPYADAVNYEEISEFFLAWYEKHILRMFPHWYADSKRALAVKGNEDDFKKAMVDCYRRLAEKMPDDGMQVVMFTHQDAAVWADLTTILWAAGLRVTAAWTIATETDSSLKQGNYVQGTVLLVLRKRTESEPVFLDEVNQKVEAEVRHQLDEMTKLEDDSDPNFGDADYQLAAYAAALRVLTNQPIEEINPEREIMRGRRSGEASPIEDLIRRAVKIACDHLVPRNLDVNLWKELDSMERFYIKGLEVESHGEYRAGVYQELARGYGANDYTELLQSTKANETRLKSAGEFGKRNLVGAGFGGSLVRQCLFAVSHSAKTEDPREGLNYLKTELSDYWIKRERIILILAYLTALRGVTGMEHWQKDAHAASLLMGMVRNDHI
jgi:putative DNA methylase